MFGVYIHFPFCRSKCGYCDFSSAATETIPHVAYANAILREVQARGLQYSTGTLRSIYLGGGTPSLWNPEQISRVLAAVRHRFGCLDDLEVTLEANPSSVDEQALASWREAGVDRLSIGVQSLDDGFLRMLGRIHTSSQAHQAVTMAREAGFRNVSCDLIFGLPGQSLEHHLGQLRSLVDLEPNHISAYSLTLAPDAPLRRQGLLPGSDDLVAEMMEQGRALLDAAGLPQYEVSSYSAPRYQSNHNALIWAGWPYLGLGAYAHSMVFSGPRTYRTINSDLSAYLQGELTGSPPVVSGAQVEVVDEPRSRWEMILLGLRTTVGLDRLAYRLRFGEDVTEHYGAAIFTLMEQGLVRLDQDRLAPTSRGIWFADDIALRMVD